MGQPLRSHSALLPAPLPCSFMSGLSLLSSAAVSSSTSASSASILATTSFGFSSGTCRDTVDKRRLGSWMRCSWLPGVEEGKAPNTSALRTSQSKKMGESLNTTPDYRHNGAEKVSAPCGLQVRDHMQHLPSSFKMGVVSET